VAPTPTRSPLRSRSADGCWIAAWRELEHDPELGCAPVIVLALVTELGLGRERDPELVLERRHC
jgi:hypothetical protein